MRQSLIPANNDHRQAVLFQPFDLPCGVVLKNRIIKSAMSDSLGDGTGHPTNAQTKLYQRWAKGDVAASIIGEVQGNGNFAEKPGNLVLDEAANLDRFRALAMAGSENGTGLWLQLGHAGALAYPSISTPNGPTALDLPSLRCDALTRDEIRKLPSQFARTAKLAQAAGFGGVQVHAAHGFLLSQFLSPLFNRCEDEYGGAIGARMRLLLDVVEAVRAAVRPDFVVAVKLNSSDQLKGGLDEEDALSVVAALNGTGIDLIDVSGGTYFPGASSVSDSGRNGPYFVDFTKRARDLTATPLMATGGFKTLGQAQDAVASGAVDLVGLARALVLEPSLPTLWRAGKMSELIFPRFSNPPQGGVTAWYTMRLTKIGIDGATTSMDGLEQAITAYETRDRERAGLWQRYFLGAA